VTGAWSPSEKKVAGGLIDGPESTSRKVTAKGTAKYLESKRHAAEFNRRHDDPGASIFFNKSEHQIFLIQKSAYAINRIGIILMRAARLPS